MWSRATIQKAPSETGRCDDQCTTSVLAQIRVGVECVRAARVAKVPEVGKATVRIYRIQGDAHFPDAQSQGFRMQCNSRSRAIGVLHESSHLVEKHH